MTPFIFVIAKELHDYNNNNAHSLAVWQCVPELFDWYMSMSTVPFNPTVASKANKSVCGLYTALARESQRNGTGDGFWKPKPKLHMFQALGTNQIFVMGNPKHFWNYADEDFMGFISTIARSRGGPQSAATTSLQVIQRFRALAVQ